MTTVGAADRRAGSVLMLRSRCSGASATAREPPVALRCRGGAAARKRANRAFSTLATAVRTRSSRRGLDTSALQASSCVSNADAAML